jgi:hypothetical protein
VSLQTGHTEYVAGTTSVSNHWHAHAVGIAVIDGASVSSGHPTARTLVTWLNDLPDGVRPDEVGGPFADPTARHGFFSDVGHQGHLHIGWRAAPIRSAADDRGRGAESAGGRPRTAPSSLAPSVSRPP